MQSRMMCRVGGVIAATALATTASAAVTAVSNECKRYASVATSRVSPSSASALQTELNNATAGRMIELRASTTYTGSFTTAGKDGNSTRHIYLCGPRSAVLKASSLYSGYNLHVNGSNYYTVDGFTLRDGSKGIMVDASSNSRIRYVRVYNIGAEGIHLRKNSKNCRVEYNLVESVGKTDPGYGEGIYVGTANGNWSSVMGSSSTPDRSDANTIRNNTVKTFTAEGLDIKEGTYGGTVTSNTFYGSSISGANSADSCVDVKGEKYTLRSNRCDRTTNDGFQTHNQSGGCANNTCPNSGKNHTWDANWTNLMTPSGGVAPGYGIRIHSTSGTGNIVYCTNTVSNKSSSYRSNVTCQ